MKKIATFECGHTAAVLDDCGVGSVAVCPGCEPPDDEPGVVNRKVEAVAALPATRDDLLALVLQGIGLYCGNCEGPTDHVFSDPDIQCEHCHWITVSVH